MVQPSKRSIAAIVSLDLHGYSRLTEQDEIGTHRALMACRRTLLEPIVRDRQGVIVKSTGDGALIRFPKASDAIDAMIRFQREVTASERSFPEARRLVFRVGIHLTPAIHEDGDVYGHGVNLAVRLQEAADPGSIFLSEAVVCQLDSNALHPLDKVGRLVLKNIKERVQIYCWRGDTVELASSRHGALGLMAAILLVGLVMPTAALDEFAPVRHELSDLARTLQLSDAKPSATSKAPTSVKRSIADRSMARKTAHAVLPAQSDDWVQPYHLVLASPLGSEIRSTMEAAQQSLENRNEIAEDAYLQARALYDRNTPGAFAQAIAELEQALTLKPDHSPAQVLLAAVYWGGVQNRWQLGRGLTRIDMLNRTHDHLAKAVEPDPLGHMVASEMLTASNRHDQAIEEAERAVTLEPTRAVGHYAKGRALLFAGRPAEAERAIRAAIRLGPHASRYLFGLALSQFSMDRFDDAERTLARATTRNGEDDWSHLLMAATQGFLGLKKEARQAIGRFDRLSLARRGWFASQIPYVHSWPFQNHEDQDRFHLGMVLAGIPEVVPVGGR